MRVHVISDIEGVAGIVNWGQTSDAGGGLFQEARVLYTEEINAAVRGAKTAGAGSAAVADANRAWRDPRLGIRRPYRSSSEAARPQS